MTENSVKSRVGQRLAVVMTAGALLTPLFTGVAFAQPTDDPPWGCIGGDQSWCRQRTGQQPTTAPAPRTSEPKLPTPKEVCTAWEGQVNVEFGTKNDLCKYIPGK
jgi:hypothetical protein